MSNTQLTCVSGYWKIKNKHDNQFEDNWFKNTLKINCPYVFFGNKESIELIKDYRGNLPTYYIELEIEDFVSYKYKDKMITHDTHCPSVELNLIWNEKIFLINIAKQINPFLSEFFMWIDAGICVYRNNPPPCIAFPNLDKMNKLPKDKLVYSSTQIKEFNNSIFTKGQYHLYHHVSGTYMLHKDIIEKYATLYKEYLKLIDKNDIWTDQVILTLMYRDNPDLFYKYCDGYGELCSILY